MTHGVMFGGRDRGACISAQRVILGDLVGGQNGPHGEMCRQVRVPQVRLQSSELVEHSSRVGRRGRSVE